LGLLTAATAFGQVTITTPPSDPNAAPSNIQAGPVNIQSGPGGTNVTVPPIAGGPVAERIRENAAIRQGERQAAREDWRMRNFNGRWWYWNPDNTWSTYQNNAWAPYSASGQPSLAAPPIPVAPAVGPATTQTTTTGPGVVVRRGPLGLRRYSVGYRGATTTTVAPAAPNLTPTPAPLPPTGSPTPAAPAPANP
jgi:hypothetical protein